MSTEQPEFVAVASTDALRQDGILSCSAGQQQLLLCRSAGNWYAVSPNCTHAGASLAGGRIVNGRIRCPLHGAAFELADGSPAAPPAFRSLRTFPVRIVDGKVEVAV